MFKERIGRRCGTETGDRYNGPFVKTNIKKFIVNNIGSNKCINSVIVQRAMVWILTP